MADENKETPAAKDDTGAAGGEGKTGAEGEVKKGEAAAAAGSKKDEAPPAGGKKEGDGETKEEKPGAKAAAPPADGKYDLELPDDAIIDDADVENIEAIAKAKGWSVEQAQAALVEYDTSLKAQSSAFLKDLKADKELGGKGLEETQRLSTLALDTIMPADEDGGDGEAFRALLTKSGYGNNRLIAKFLSRVGKMLGEDGPVKIVGGKVKEEMRPEDKMYPTTRQKPEERG